MKIQNFFYYLSGYLTVCADGPFCERLLNICMHRGLTVRNIKRCGTERVIFLTDIASYHQMRTPAYRTKSHVRILSRHGIPFILQRYRHRKIAVWGIILLALMLWYTSNHVMGITIFGNTRIDTEYIRSTLAQCGLTLGVKTSEIEPDILRGKMMQKVNDLAWIGINANGSRVYIEIIERIQKDEGVEKDGIAQNLVASKDGVIDGLEVKEGQTMVKLGSGVRQGDVLVSGIVDNNTTGFRYVKARGEVYAETRYSKTRSYPLKYTENVKTGRAKNRYAISVMNLNIPLFFAKNPPYENFSAQEETSEYKPPVDMLPSLFIKKQTFFEEKAENKSRTVKDAVAFAAEELATELKAELGENAEIKEQNQTYTINEHGEAEVTVTLICRENIAVPHIISRE